MCYTPYNEVPHEKIISEPMNDLLKLLIKSGHDKEKQITSDLFDEVYEWGLDPLTDTLATMSDGDLSRVLNYIVKDVKVKKSKLETEAKKNKKNG